jgi:uncharacterized protein YjbI with pentapeptide repeats
MRGAVLTDVDLRGSNLRGMQIGVKELKGAIIEPRQAAEVAMLLGMVVKPLEVDG